MPRAHFQTVRRQLPRDLGLVEHKRKNTTATDKDGAPWYVSEVTLSGEDGGEYVTFLAESPLTGPVVEMPGTDFIGAVMDLRKGVYRPVTKARMDDWSDEVGMGAYQGGDAHRFASLVSRVAHAHLTKQSQDKTAVDLAEGLDVPRKLVDRAEKEVQAEIEALKAVESAFNDWLALRKRQGAGGLEAIREHLDANYENRVWRDTVYSAFSHATWGGLDTQKFYKHVKAGLGELGGRYGTLGGAENVLDVLKAMK